MSATVKCQCELERFALKQNCSALKKNMQDKNEEDGYSHVGANWKQNSEAFETQSDL